MVKLKRPAAILLSDTIRRVSAHIDGRTIAAFGLPFLLYLLTLAPTIYNLDSAELTTAAATGGFVHATGYPLYLMLGWIWSRLPIGDMGYRMNLFSALNSALTIALAERILRRLRVGRWAAWGALGLLASAPYFWALSLIAEVYTMHTALMAGTILLLLRWTDAPSPRRLALIGLAVGLSLSHHAATILLIPGLVLYLVTTKPRQVFTPRSLSLALGALLLGLSTYLYLPLRYSAHPAFNYLGSYDATGTFSPIDLQTPRGLWWLISGRAFANLMLAYRGIEIWEETKRLGIQLWQAFFAIGIGPGLVGIAVLLRRNWQLGTALLLMFIGNAGFYINYLVVDKVTMFLPNYLIWAFWLGIGYQWLLGWMRKVEGERMQQWSIWLLRSVIAGAVVLAAAQNWRLVDLSNDRSARVHGETILYQLEPNALIFSWWDTTPVIEYLQLVEGKRPDVKAINRFMIPYDDMCKLIEREAAHRPVYIDSLTADLLQVVEAEPAGPIHRLQPRQEPHAPDTAGP